MIGGIIALFGNLGLSVEPDDGTGLGNESSSDSKYLFFKSVVFRESDGNSTVDFGVSPVSSGVVGKIELMLVPGSVKVIPKCGCTTAKVVMTGRDRAEVLIHLSGSEPIDTEIEILAVNNEKHKLSLKGRFEPFAKLEPSVLLVAGAEVFDFRVDWTDRNRTDVSVHVEDARFDFEKIDGTAMSAKYRARKKKGVSTQSLVYGSPIRIWFKNPVDSRMYVDLPIRSTSPSSVIPRSVLFDSGTPSEPIRLFALFDIQGVSLDQLECKVECTPSDGEQIEGSATSQPIPSKIVKGFQDRVVLYLEPSQAKLKSGLYRLKIEIRESETKRVRFTNDSATLTVLE